jgi:glycosyltransferase involved in cell wall biosynthesis
VEKHLHVLIEAFRDIHSRARRAPHLLIVGSGTDFEHLKNLTYEYNIHDYVTFTGRVTDEEIIELHKVGTVFAMPSPAELQSIATLEAMASGKPVVAVDAGALKELCQDSENGFLCERDNVAEFGDGILKILDDPELIERFSRKSLEIASHHDIKNTLDKFEDIYGKVMKMKTPQIPQRLL